MNSQNNHLYLFYVPKCIGIYSYMYYLMHLYRYMLFVFCVLLHPYTEREQPQDNPYPNLTQSSFKKECGFSPLYNKYVENFFYARIHYLIRAFRI